MLHPNNGDFPVRSYSSPCEAPCEAASEPTEKHSPWNTVTSWAPQLVPDFLMQCWHNNGRYRYLLHIYIYIYIIIVIFIIIVLWLLVSLLLWLLLLLLLYIYIYYTYVCIYMNQTTANIIPHIKQIGLGRGDVIILYIYIWVWHMRYDINIWYMIYDVWYMICIYAIRNMYIVGFPNLRHNPPFIAPAWWWEPSWSLATSHSWNTSRHHGRNFGVIFLKRCSSVAFLP